MTLGNKLKGRKKNWKNIKKVKAIWDYILQFCAHTTEAPEGQKGNRKRNTKRWPKLLQNGFKKTNPLIQEA